ncbi:hypothetical protein OTK49_01930 [Vibrio coralliirubri]|uniref:hypothetical protein n=1 Tax=Vibrio coralliirubri TaxID=1516159 RepID=UPI0022850596|nr:hypothetical protein [Vibrio coralliirubri]MCY9861273.1 hypothetical protein [Vibrio coralliirubri]
MSSVKSTDFRLIEALLFRYGKFSTSDITTILRCSVSKVRKLTSAYAKEYSKIHGTPAYSVVIHEAASATECRRFEVNDSFKPISITLEGDKLGGYFEEILAYYSLFNSVQINETSLDGDNVVLHSVKPNTDAREDGYYGLFLLLDFLLEYNNSFDLIELNQILKLSDAKRARYFANIYRNHTDVVYCKVNSRYQKGGNWLPVVLKPHHNPLTFFECSKFNQ